MKTVVQEKMMHLVKKVIILFGENKDVEKVLQISSLQLIVLNLKMNVVLVLQLTGVIKHIKLVEEEI